MSSAELYEDMLGCEDENYSSPRVNHYAKNGAKAVIDKINTHIVIKREDALKYLTEVEYQSLEEIQNTIVRGRAKDKKKPINSYYVCNTDEPYAEVVRGVIIGGEAVKNKNLN